MKKLLLIAVIGVAGYGYYQTTRPCASPISYKIGTFDTKFGISQAEFVADTEQAAELWNDAAGKQIFKYDPKGSLPVNLVYDERQANIDKTKTLEAQVNETKKSADEIKAEFQSLETQYDQKKSEYNALPIGSRARENKRLEVNALVEQINTLVHKYNYLVNTVNSTITNINQTAGQEFEEGEYVVDNTGKRINIYEFENKTDLVRVLAHELGHALGLEHNSNPDSIMYYLNSSSSKKLTPDDVLSLKMRCSL